MMRGKELEAFCEAAGISVRAFGVLARRKFPGRKGYSSSAFSRIVRKNKPLDEDLAQWALTSIKPEPEFATGLAEFLAERQRRLAEEGHGAKASQVEPGAVLLTEAPPVPALPEDETMKPVVVPLSPAPASAASVVAAAAPAGPPAAEAVVSAVPAPGAARPAVPPEAEVVVSAVPAGAESRPAVPREAEVVVSAVPAGAESGAAVPPEAVAPVSAVPVVDAAVAPVASSEAEAVVSAVPAGEESGPVVPLEAEALVSAVPLVMPVQGGAAVPAPVTAATPAVPPAVVPVLPQSAASTSAPAVAAVASQAGVTGPVAGPPSLASPAPQPAPAVVQVSRPGWRSRPGVWGAAALVILGVAVGALVVFLVLRTQSESTHALAQCGQQMGQLGIKALEAGTVWGRAVERCENERAALSNQLYGPRGSIVSLLAGLKMPEGPLPSQYRCKTNCNREGQETCIVDGQPLRGVVGIRDGCWTGYVNVSWLREPAAPKKCPEPGYDPPPEAISEDRDKCFVPLLKPKSAPQSVEPGRDNGETP